MHNNIEEAYQALLKIKNISKYGSWTIWGVPSNDEIISQVGLNPAIKKVKSAFPPTKTLVFNNEWIATSRARYLNLQNKYMFLGLNCAKRKNLASTDWSMFHDIELPLNTYKLAFSLNDTNFRGCYITDVLKDTIESSSTIIRNNYKVASKKKIVNVESNRIYKSSAGVLSKELEAIKPEQLICFGRPAKQLLVKMKQDGLLKNVEGVNHLIDNALVTTHYSSVGGILREEKDVFIEHSKKTTLGAKFEVARIIKKRLKNDLSIK